MSKAVLFSFLLVLTACGVSRSSPAYDLSAQFDAERVKLAQLKEQRETWQLAAKQAEEHAKYGECRVQLRELQVAVKNKLISCQEEHARESECKGAEAKTSAGGMAIGCGIGLLFPPLGLLGCLGGAALGSAGADNCIEPICESDPDVVLRDVLAEQHLDALPQCQAPEGDAWTLNTALH